MNLIRQLPGGTFWITLAFFLWALTHSLLASPAAKLTARKIAGPTADRYYRLAYNMFAILSLLPVAWLMLISEDRSLYLIPFPWNVPFLLGQLAAIIAFFMSAFQTGGMAFLGITAPSASGQGPGLVTGGPYRFVRHPIYSSGLLLLWLSPHMTVNRLVITSAITFYILIAIPLEEHKLLQEFGVAYKDYAKATPALIPFMKKRNSP